MRARLKHSTQGDFPLGSLESRAAARKRLEQKRNSKSRLEIVSNISRPWRGDGAEPASWNGEPRFDPWQDYGDSLIRMVYLRGEWRRNLPEIMPVCTRCGTPFVEVKRLAGWVYLQANCRELHDPDRVASHRSG